MATPNTLFYYNFPVHYRIEHRADGDVFIFSYRQEIGGNMRIVYEHPPRRIPALEELLKEAVHTNTWADGNGRTLLEQLDEPIMDEFFHDLLDIESDSKTRAVGLERRHTIPELTMGVLFAADRTTLIAKKKEGSESKRSPFSIQDDIRTIRCLSAKEGGTRWKDATLAHCLDWLSNESIHMRRACWRMMQKVLLPFFRSGQLDDLLGWESYDPTAGIPHKPTYEGLVRNNILPSALSYGQCQKLLGKLFDSEGNIRTVSGIDVALLLKLTLGADTAELSALKTSSFKYLDQFSDRLTVCITQQFHQPPGGGNCRLQDIEDPYQKRTLPLPHLVKQCFEALPARRKGKNESPLVSNKTNSNRHMTPKDLDRELENRVLALFDGNLPKIEGIRAVGIKAMLDNTAARELRKSGCEDEELRFIQGKRPLLVSAISYADFTNEAELNKLGALQDRWLNKVVPARSSRDSAAILKKDGGSISWGTSYPESRTHVAFQIPFDAKLPNEIPEEGILLELHALHGFSATILWNPKE